MARVPRRTGSGIDWAAAHQRLRDLGRLISGETEQTPAQIRLVLEARARSLSTPLATPDAEEMLELFAFGVSGERYSVESRYVLAALRLEHITLVPSAEPPLVGLTAWRGELLALLDLRVLTGTSAAPLSDLGWIVVLGEPTGPFGILVDELHTIARLPLSSIAPLPAGLSRTREYVRGITSEAMLVLDAAALTRIHT